MIKNKANSSRSVRYATEWTRATALAKGTAQRAEKMNLQIQVGLVGIPKELADLERRIIRQNELLALEE